MYIYKDYLFSNAQTLVRDPEEPACVPQALQGHTDGDGGRPKAVHGQATARQRAPILLWAHLAQGVGIV